MHIIFLMNDDGSRESWKLSYSSSILSNVHNTAKNVVNNNLRITFYPFWTTILFFPGSFHLVISKTVCLFFYIMNISTLLSTFLTFFNFPDLIRCLICYLSWWGTRLAIKEVTKLRSVMGICPVIITSLVLSLVKPAPSITFWIP